MHTEQSRNVTSGYVALPFVLLSLVGGIGLLRWASERNLDLLLAVGIVIVAMAGLGLLGFFMVHPNQARVLQLFGNYVGTTRNTGLRWANPFYTKKAVSLRIRNFESGQLKVNDQSGSPIEIAAVVVWRVVDTAEAIFEVDDYEEFVRIQSESALRNLANVYPYEDHEGQELSLRGDPIQVSEALRKEIQERLNKAGVEVTEARISHLAYAPEIASAMLRRQQASAIIAARTQVVAGAVGMVQLALEELRRSDIVELDEERKAAMVSNLLVVLCSDENAQPVLNAGSLY